MYNAEDIMTKNLTTVSQSEPLVRAYKVMSEKKIRHLPVTDNSGQIVGLLSDRDLQRAMIAESVEMGIAGGVLDMALSFDPAHSVRDFMTYPVRVVDYKMTVKDVAELMIESKISSFLVVNGRQILGIVTTEDMLKVLVELLKNDPGTLQRTIDGFTRIWDPLY
jgi:CBS domain-containing protein